MGNILIITILLVIALLVIFMLYNRSKVNKTFTPTSSSTAEPIQKTNILTKAFKLISYKEALEASKKFIFDIAKAVIQRFTPDDQKIVSREGKVLFNKGVEYIHVVDVLSLSIQKERDMRLNKFAHSKNRDLAARK